LSELGRPAEALPVAEEAVAMYRNLAAISSDRYRPGLARSLAWLAAIHEVLGQVVQAGSLRDEAAKFSETPSP